MTTRDYAKQILEDINGRSGMDTGAYDDDTINDMLEAWSKVIAEARREAIEEALKIAEDYATRQDQLRHDVGFSYERQCALSDAGLEIADEILASVKP